MFSKCKVLFLISCSNQKRSIYTSAKFLYCSERFKLAEDLMERIGAEWFILSAKNGLLNPNALIQPYDVSLSDLSDEQIEKWANDVTKKISTLYDNSTKIIVLADSMYAKAISGSLLNFGYQCTTPFMSFSHEDQINYLINIRRDNAIRLYSRMKILSENTGGIRLFSECNGKMYWPQKGVYLFVDFNEFSTATCYIPKIIRVGTHGVSSGSKTKLWDRLKTHRGLQDGGGSHRSSVFRLHVGNALIKKNNLSCESWACGQSAPYEVRDVERNLESMVSEYIGKLGVIFIDIDDESSSHSDRAYIESNTIAALSAINFSMDFASLNWLGFESNKSEIRMSSLWNINGVRQNVDSDYFNKLDLYIEKTICNYNKVGS